jgi:ATP synthase protein I
VSTADGKQTFVESVAKRRELHEKHERDGDRSFWQSVGTMGTVGWSIAIPMTAGTLFGRWLDTRLASGHVFMFFFMLVGLSAGCTVVWRMIMEKR